MTHLTFSQVLKKKLNVDRCHGETAEQRGPGVVEKTWNAYCGRVVWVRISSRSLRVLNKKDIWKLQLHGPKRVLMYLGQCQNKRKAGRCIREANATLLEERDASKWNVKGHYCIHGTSLLQCWSVAPQWSL